MVTMIFALRIVSPHQDVQDQTHLQLVWELDDDSSYIYNLKTAIYKQH
jgi:hypothetical protein